MKSLSRVLLFATPWTVAYQAFPSMGFSRQEYWSGLPFPSPGDLLNPGIKPGSSGLQADSLPSEPPRKPCLSIFKLGCLFSYYRIFRFFNIYFDFSIRDMICRNDSPSMWLFSLLMSRSSSFYWGLIYPFFSFMNYKF